ncbi:MAG: serine hydrolase domain-containing protein [Spirochaetota bacterium]
MPQKEIANTFKRKFTRLYTEKNFNGTVLLAQNNTVLWQAALGIADFRNGNELSLASTFNLASVSKPIFATAILLLKEQRKLRLKDPITKYLPGLYAPGVTVRHLLHHTSGLADYIELMDEHWTKKRQVENKDVLRLFQKLQPKLYFSPGSKFEYSNTGYAFLANIIAKASGKTVQEFLQQEIFTELGMANTHLCNAGSPESSLQAIGFRSKKTRNKLYHQTYLDGVSGDGNICSNVTDLLKFDNALRNGKLLQDATLRKAYKPAKIKGKKSYYGFGWELYPSGDFVEHSGEWQGFRTYFGRDLSSGYTFIVLDNSNNSAMLDTVQSILDKFYQ